MAISYDELNESNKGKVTDLLSKREAINSALADIQTKRAAEDVIQAAKEQELHAENNRLTEELRKMRKATLT